MMLARPTSDNSAEIEKIVGLYQTGELTRATRLCQRILTAQPNHSGVLHLFGVIRHKTGDYAQAVDLIEQAVVLNPGLDSGWCNLGLAHNALGQHEPAIDCYQRALSLNPFSVAACLNLGMALSAVGEVNQAIFFYDRALYLKPDLAQAHYNLGNALWSLGQYFEAELGYRRALSIQPDFPEASLNLGIALADLGRFSEAIALYRRTLQLRPEWAGAYFKLGMALLSTKRLNEAALSFQRALAINPQYPAALIALAETQLAGGQAYAAITTYRQALEIDPDSASAHLNLGKALRDLRQYDEAIFAFQRAAELKPDYAQAYYYLSKLLHQSGQPEEAANSFSRATQQLPAYAHALLAIDSKGGDDNTQDETMAQLDHATSLGLGLPEFFSNKGNALMAFGQMDEAVANFDSAIALQPDSTLLKYNKSLALLLGGKLAQGWPLYEHRPARSNVAPDAYGCPCWEGESLAGKRLLLVKEQGWGDQIQFLRYVPLLAALGATVDILVDAPLRRLAESVPGVTRVIDALPDAPEYDFWSLLLSVPYRLGTRLDNIPHSLPYLAAPKDAIAAWSADIDDFARGRRRVGLVWAGPDTHVNNRNRSIPLEMFAPLAQIDGICLVILQQDASPEALARVFHNTEVLLAGEQCKDFSDTAAAIMNLDLVISVDTAVAHLAGALGCQVSTLLPCNRDWRWLLERDDSPWYPGMRLYRQQEYRQWEEVIARLVQDISAGR
ncbi:MAG: tetratricopeptide repeat protein [Sulfuriferula sp.]